MILAAIAKVKAPSVHRAGTAWLALLLAIPVTVGAQTTDPVVPGQAPANGAGRSSSAGQNQSGAGLVQGSPTQRTTDPNPNGAGRSRTAPQLPGSGNNVLGAETPSVTGTVTGVITAFAANGFTFIAVSDNIRVQFIAGATTEFLSSAGVAVPLSYFTNQMPVTVSYIRTGTGNDWIATRVMETPAPATVAAGVITEVRGDMIVIALNGQAAQQASFAVNQNTTFVNLSGAAEPLDLIKPGLPVKISFTRIASTVLATTVQVQR